VIHKKTHWPKLLLLLCCFVTHSSIGQVLLDAANDAFNDLRLNEANQLLAEFSEQEAATARSFYLTARIAILQGQLETASSVATKCQQQFPRETLCYEVKGEAELVKLLLQGGVLRKIGAARSARKALERAVEYDAENMRARILLVRYYTLAPWLLGGSKSKARDQIEICRAYNAAFGHEAQALYDLGVGNTAAAVKGFAKAQALLPGQRDPALFLAKAYLADKQPEAAIATLESLVDQYPRFQEAWLELGRIAADNQLESDRGKAALEYYLADVEGESQSRRADAFTTLARLYLNADQPERAVSLLRRAQLEHPDNRPIRKFLAEVCRDQPVDCRP
jgi:predicted Zn-dependent protease